MGSDHLEPFVGVQGSKKWMWHVVFLQIFATCFFHENERSLANFAKLRQHRFLLAKQGWIERNWRLAPNQTRLNERQGKMNPFQERNRFWRALQQLICVSNDRSLDHDQVADQFRSGPTAFAWASVPLLRRNATGHG